MDKIDLTYSQKLKRVQGALPMGISNFAEHQDGFSFTVATEIDAYKAAYVYRFTKNVIVSFAPNISEWLVQVYTDG